MVARTGRLRRRVIRQVVVLEVTGRLIDVAKDLDRAIQLALAEGPRGVVCDLSAAPESAERVAIELLGTAGRHVRDWAATPVAVASPDPRVRAALAAQPLGGHLIIVASLFSAVSAVLAAPAPAVESLRLAPHPTAPRASRGFITRTLPGWQLDPLIPVASQLTSELVASSSVTAGTDIDLSVAWSAGVLRLSVRDHGPALTGQCPAPPCWQGASPTVTGGLVHAFGVLPARDGGRVAWAVLEAPRPRPSTGPIRSARCAARRDSSS